MKFKYYLCWMLNIYSELMYSKSRIFILSRLILILCYNNSIRWTFATSDDFSIPHKTKLSSSQNAFPNKWEDNLIITKTSIWCDRIIHMPFTPATFNYIIKSGGYHILIYNLFVKCFHYRYAKKCQCLFQSV